MTDQFYQDSRSIEDGTGPGPIDATEDDAQLDLKSATISIRALSWQFHADTGHHGPVAFSLVYLGLCRILALVVSSRAARPTRMSSWWSSVTRSGSGLVKLTVASGTGQSTAPS